MVDDVYCHQQKEEGEGNRQFALTLASWFREGF